MIPEIAGELHQIIVGNGAGQDDVHCGFKVAGLRLKVLRLNKHGF
jgi:hypothetical protein